MSAANLQVLATGPLAIPVDLGRTGWAHAGVAPSGPFDLAAHLAANATLGNAPGAATLEIVLGGLRLRADRAVTMCLTGAPAPIRVDGLPLAHARPFALPAGAEVDLGHPGAGLRSYLAVAGGFDLPAVLGSRSYDTLAHLGPPPIRVGQVIAVGHERAPVRSQPLPPVEHDGATRLGFFPPPRPLPPRATAGFAAATWRISADSDRVAVRLDGPAILPPPGQVPSEGVVIGAIQLPPSGQPLIFGPDHPLTGGYPILGVLARDGVDRLAQLAPGQVVGFAPEASTRSH